MSKIYIYVVAFFLSFASQLLHSQENNRQVSTTNVQSSHIFYHIVERGQTVYSIAAMYQISVEDIYRLNPDSRNGIKISDTLKIPQRGTVVSTTTKEEANYIYHAIQPKETLYSLTVKYAMSAQQIMDANPGLTTASFNAGQTIRIPSVQQESSVKTVVKEVDYTIQKKETLYSISRKFNTSITDLVKRNPELREGMKTGQVIKVPVESEQAVALVSNTHREAEINTLLTAKSGSIKQVDRVKVALMLPFMTEEIVPSSTTSRFIEYYEGLLLAVDSLRNMGYSIELSVYDIGNDTKKMMDILKDESLQHVNLIIGGVQNEQSDLLADYAQRYDIKYVIPLSSKNDNVLSNPNVFQINTPHPYLYSKAAQTGCNIFSDDNIIIVHIGDKEEKFEFVKAFKEEMLLRSKMYKELTFKTETFASDIEALLSPSNRNIILPSSASLEALTKIKSTLRSLTDPAGRLVYTINLFGYPEWQTYTRECLEDFFVLNTYIYTNFYADNQSLDVQRFYSKYKKWYGKIPIRTYPKYSILGFDTGMYFIQMIRKYGMDFESHLENDYYSGLQTGFHFERVNNWGGFVNTSLFIVQYRNDYSIIRNEIK